MTDPCQVLQTSRSILLVDWPSPGVPRALLAAGLSVFGYSPRGYSKAEITASPPQDVGPHNIFAPRDQTERGYLVFRLLPAPPTAVDIVAVYRPSAELPAILADHAVPLGAKVLWFLRPVTSAQERSLVLERNLIVVEHLDIISTARAVPGPK